MLSNITWGPRFGRTLLFARLDDKVGANIVAMEYTARADKSHFHLRRNMQLMPDAIWVWADKKA